MIDCEAGVLDILNGSTVVHSFVYFIISGSYTLRESMPFPAHQENEQSSSCTIVYDIK